MAHIPPMEPLVAANLHPWLSTASSRAWILPHKADRFQSTMTERAYKATALTLRAPNATSMLSAYQGGLFDDIAWLWDKITTTTDICLRIQRSAVQAEGKCMSMLVLQERVRGRVGWIWPIYQIGKRRSSWTCLSWGCSIPPVVKHLVPLMLSQSVRACAVVFGCTGHCHR